MGFGVGGRGQTVQPVLTLKQGRNLYSMLGERCRWKKIRLSARGKGLTSGWWLLVEKLHYLGMVAREGLKEGDFVGEASVGSLQVRNGIPINGKKETLCYVKVVNPISVVGRGFVCIEVGEEDFKDRLGQMECCLVGRWEEASSPILELEAVRKWAISSWMLKGRLHLVRLGRKLLLFEFENLSEAN